MKQIISATLCLLSLPLFAAEPMDKKADGPKREERRRGARRTTVILVRERPSIWGSIAGGIAGAVTMELIESRRAARAERLYRQYEEAQSFNDPNASHRFEPMHSKIDRTPMTKPAPLPPMETAAAPAPEVKAEAKPDPNAFKAKIYGLN